MPARLTRPKVGFSPTVPHKAAGMRIDPPVSDPSATTAVPCATAAAEPPLDPPGTRSSTAGFRTGPYADKGGYDLIAQGMSGLMSVTGEAGRAPAKSGGPVCDINAGILGALGVVSAYVHRLKTGALIRASVLMAAACSPALSRDAWNALDGYARDIGLAFQIQDDILDVEGKTEEIGKTSGVELVRVATSQHTALFFQKQGFKEISVQKDGYAPGIDRIEMVMKLAVCA